MGGEDMQDEEDREGVAEPGVDLFERGGHLLFHGFDRYILLFSDLAVGLALVAAHPEELRLVFGEGIDDAGDELLQLAEADGVMGDDIHGHAGEFVFDLAVDLIVADRFKDLEPDSLVEPVAEVADLKPGASFPKRDKYFLHRVLGDVAAFDDPAGGDKELLPVAVVYGRKSLLVVLLDEPDQFVVVQCLNR